MKIFEDYPTVDCNDCELYWNNQCDGVSDVQERPCRAFKPTRNREIPREIDALKSQVNRLQWASIINAVLLCIHLALELFA